MELKILRRQAIFEIEQYLKKNTPEPEESAGSVTGARSASTLGAGLHASFMGINTADDIMTLQTLRSHASPQQAPQPRYRGYFATPTSTCSDIGALRDPGRLPDAPPAPIYLSPPSTQGSLPPLDEQRPVRKHDPIFRQRHHASSSSLGDIPELRSYTMPDIRSAMPDFRHTTLGSLPSQSEILEAEEEDEEDLDQSPSPGRQPASSSQSGGPALEHLPASLLSQAAFQRNANPPPFSQSEDLLQHSLELEQLRQELMRQSGYVNMHTIGDLSDLRNMQLRSTLQQQIDSAAWQRLPAERRAADEPYSRESSAPPGLDRVPHADCSNSGLVNAPSMNSQAATFHF